jgi:hypothetical protein
VIPYVNATLTAITPPGASADYDQPATAGTARWTGTAAIYIAEELLQIETPGRLDEIVRARVEIPYNVGRLVQRGDTLAFTYENSAQTGVAANIIHASLVGRVRVLLEDR